MSNRLTICAAFGLALAAGPAMASFSLNGYKGPIEIGINGFDAGSLYPALGGPGTVCATALACDAAVLLQAPNSYPIGGPGSPLGDTWGALHITEITDEGTNPIWTQSAAERLTGMFYGIADDVVTYNLTSGGASEWTALGIGGYMDIYLRAGAVPTYAQFPAGRTSLSTYPTATDGQIFLRLQFTPTPEYGDPIHTFRSQFTNVSTSGNASGYLDIIGGDYDWVFDTNSVPDLNGNLHDFGFDLTFNSQGVCVGVPNPPTSCWTVRIQGQAIGAAPEPGTLALLALGVLGAAARSRRPGAAPAP